MKELGEKTMALFIYNDCMANHTQVSLLCWLWWLITKHLHFIERVNISKPDLGILQVLNLAPSARFIYRLSLQFFFTHSRYNAQSRAPQGKLLTWIILLLYHHWLKIRHACWYQWMKALFKRNLKMSSFYIRHWDVGL